MENRLHQRVKPGCLEIIRDTVLTGRHLVCGHTKVKRVCERGETWWHIYKKRGITERKRESRQKEKTEIHLFDTESLRKCRGMSSTPLTVCGG